MTEISPEAGQLIGLLAEGEIPAEPPAQADWDRLIDLAQRQKVAPLLHERLKQRGIALPPAAADHLRRIYLASAGRGLRLLHELGSILHALQSAGIPVIPLKGACLVEVVYGNPALRSMGDVDLLVKPSDVTRSLDILRALGYVAAHAFEIGAARQVSQHMPPLYKPGGLTVELHATIVNPCRNVRFDERDLDGVWSRATPASIAGVDVLMLSPTDMLWHLCLHASVQHRFDRITLRDFWDIALVIRRFGDEIDFDLCARLASLYGITNGMHAALSMTEEWTGVALPAALMRSLAPTAPDELGQGQDQTQSRAQANGMAWARHKIWHETVPAVKTNLARLEGPAPRADKLTALLGVLFPSRATMARVYHAPASSWRIWLYYPVRIKDLWSSQSRTIWHLIRRQKAVTTELRQEARLREYLGEIVNEEGRS